MAERNKLGGATVIDEVEELPREWRGPLLPGGAALKAVEGHGAIRAAATVTW